jgi:3-deoxy-D-manno-octulosonic-acid transferase
MIVLDLARSVVGVVGMAASKIAPLDERFALDQRINGPWPEGPFLWLHGASLGNVVCFSMSQNISKKILKNSQKF